MTKHHLLSAALVVLFSFSLAVPAEAAKPALAKSGLKAAILDAKTPQDHLRIAAYYNKQAERMLVEAKEHDELAVVYGQSGNAHGSKHPMSGLTVEHCKYFADATRKAALESQELAKMHESMAK